MLWEVVLWQRSVFATISWSPYWSYISVHLSLHCNNTRNTRSNFIIIQLPTILVIFCYIKTEVLPVWWLFMLIIYGTCLKMPKNLYCMYILTKIIPAKNLSRWLNDKWKLISTINLYCLQYNCLSHSYFYMHLINSVSIANILSIFNDHLYYTELYVRCSFNIKNL
jgi:hypothetical protein